MGSLECQCDILSANAEKHGNDFTVNFNSTENKLQLAFFPENIQCEISIFDLYGRKVLQSNFYSNTDIDVGFLPYGIYIYNISINMATIRNGKILKIR